MAHAEKTLTVNRSPNDVFDFILEGKNNPLWRPSVADIVQLPGTSLGIGSAFKQGMKGPGGRRIDADYKIVKCDRPRLIAFEVTSGPARPTGTYSFAPQGNGTAVTFVLDYQPRGLAKLMDGMIQNQMEEEVTTLENLKRHLEGAGR